jgi:hypothetical protein
VDDENSSSMTLRPGETMDLPPARSQITMIIGNRQNLRLKINKRRAEFPSDLPNFKAQVRINQDNVQDFLREN